MPQGCLGFRGLGGIQGLYGDDGEESGNYHNGLYEVLGLWGYVV